MRNPISTIDRDVYAEGRRRNLDLISFRFTNCDADPAGIRIGRCGDLTLEACYLSLFGSRRSVTIAAVYFVNRTPGPAPFPGRKITPATSSAFRIACRLLSMGRRLLVSKSRIVETLTHAASANCGWDQLISARAARDWAGVSMPSS